MDFKFDVNVRSSWRGS